MPATALQIVGIAFFTNLVRLLATRSHLTVLAQYESLPQAFWAVGQLV